MAASDKRKNETVSWYIMITAWLYLIYDTFYNKSVTPWFLIFQDRIPLDLPSSFTYWWNILVFRSKFGTWQNQFKSFKKIIFVSLADCGGIINISEDNTEDAIITSANYPDPYKPKQECSWTIMVCAIQDSFNATDQRVFGVVFSISCLANFISLLINGDLLLIL